MALTTGLGIVFILLGLFLLVFTPGDFNVLLSKNQVFAYNHVERTYLTTKPKNTKKVKNIVIALHGFTDMGRRFAYYSAIHNAASKDTVVIYPNAIAPTKPGIKTGWNAGYCCGSGWVQKADDAGFILALKKELQSKYNVADNHVFIAGFSNGAMLAQRLATEYPKEFGGVVSVSGTTGIKTFHYKPDSAVPILLIHGQKDSYVPFDGGAGHDKDFSWQSFQQTLEAWQKANNCSDEQKDVNQSKGVTTTDYTGCIQPIRTIVYSNGTHQWPGWRIWQLNRRTPEGSKLAIQFFDSL